MKIFLIGMPGCGKSTFGKRVAEKLELEFIDLDKELIQQEGTSINEIFEYKGEEYFRQIESEMLKNIAVNRDNYIMATGGGAPCFFDNIDFMNTQGLTIFIDTPVDDLIERLNLKGIDKRPLLRKIGTENLRAGLEDQLKKRLSFYTKATISLPYHKSMEMDIIEAISSRI